MSGFVQTVPVHLSPIRTIWIKAFGLKTQDPVRLAQVNWFSIETKVRDFRRMRRSQDQESGAVYSL